jgi:ABC-2 type transport system permease protein
MMLRIGNLIIKELIQFGRDRLLTMFILLAPALQLLLLAQAIERGINQQPVVILDLDRSYQSRRLITNLDTTEELWVRFHVDSPDEMRHLLDEGRARMAVVIPAGFARELASTSSTQSIQVIADATNTMAASITMSAASGVVSRFAADLAANHGMIVPEFIDFRTNVRFNPTMDVRAYSIPAQLGFITYQVTLAVAALGLARERELGTLEQLMVTPLRRFELTVGKGVPAIAIGGMNFAVMWFISLVVFQVPMNGSPLLLAALTLLFITTEVSWGLVISSISRTQQQAILFVFIQAMVDMTFSGFMVPVKNMPALLQVISRFVPLQHYLSIVRGIMLKGAGLDELWPHVFALILLSLGMGLVALRSVSRRLE